MRFVFSSGRDRSFRFLTLVERADGRSWMESGGLDWRVRQARRTWPRQRQTLSAQDWIEINRLVEAADAFEFDVGSWDGDEIYMHCQNLVMERANQDGYRFSSAAIGCNRPEKLVPLLEKVIALAGRQPLFAGWVPDS
jgi:hypothetical protein